MYTFVNLIKQINNIMNKAIYTICVLILMTVSCTKETIKDLNKVDGIRYYYVAADVVEWDYAPSGRNDFMDKEFGEDEEVFVKHDTNFIGRKYMKAMYREYTDASFSTLKPKESADMGILGPVIRAEVGDSIVVVFKNNSDFEVTMHPHGVRYRKEHNGHTHTDTMPDPEGLIGVKPGTTYTYSWFAHPSSGPTDGMTSLGWMYHTHVHDVNDRDLYEGLVGPLVIYLDGELDANGKPKTIQKEKFAFLMVWNENLSRYFQKNVDKYTDGKRAADPAEFEESNLMHAINGLMYGNCHYKNLGMGEKVRWYTFALGNEVDLHTAHWHGMTLVYKKQNVDVIDLLPATMTTSDMIADNPGTWQFHCHIHDHLQAGMQALYTIK
jgi:manganese oxidase